MQTNPTAKFNPETERQFIDMWDNLCRLIESRLAPKLTKDQLNLLSPLFYSALQSSHTGIRKRARLMWWTGFSKTKHRIPESLFEVLKGLGLPPASTTEIVPDDSMSPKDKETKSAGKLIHFWSLFSFLMIILLMNPRQ